MAQLPNELEIGILGCEHKRANPRNPKSGTHIVKECLHDQAPNGTGVHGLTTILQSSVDS